MKRAMKRQHALVALMQLAKRQPRGEWLVTLPDIETWLKRLAELDAKAAGRLEPAYRNPKRARFDVEDVMAKLDLIWEQI